MTGALVIALAMLAPFVQGARSQTNEPKSPPANGTSVPHLLRSTPGVFPKSLDMTQHVLTQSGNMLVLSTPTKPNVTAAKSNISVISLPKRSGSISDQILAKSESEETKARARNHKLQVPPHVDHKKVEKKAPPAKPKEPKREATKPATIAKGTNKPPATSKVMRQDNQKQMQLNDAKDQAKKKPAQRDAKESIHHVGLLSDVQQVVEEKSQVSLADFYAQEDKTQSDEQSWHFAAHVQVKTSPSPAHTGNADQHKVAAFLDRQAHNTASRWQRTLAETQREVLESRLDNSIAISDQFSGLESKDTAIEQEVKREDRAAIAGAAPDGRALVEANFHSDQVHLSKAFSALEQQDHAIESYLHKAGDDADLSEIRKAQDESMNHISQELKHADEHPEEGRLPPRPIGREFLETHIHDQWADFEKSDGLTVKDIKRDPNLRAFIQRGVTSRHD